MQYAENALLNFGRKFAVGLTDCSGIFQCYGPRKIREARLQFRSSLVLRFGGRLGLSIAILGVQRTSRMESERRATDACVEENALDGPQGSFHRLVPYERSIPSEALGWKVAEGLGVEY